MASQSCREPSLPPPTAAQRDPHNQEAPEGRDQERSRLHDVSIGGVVSVPALLSEGSHSEQRKDGCSSIFAGRSVRRLMRPPPEGAPGPAEFYLRPQGRRL
ncbi:hypothetical protein FKM82_003176 [Ascaphus truei]